MNGELSKKYDFVDTARHLRTLADELDDLGSIGSVECENFIKKNNLEYIREEVEITFREGFKVGMLAERKSSLGRELDKQENEK